MRRTLLMLACSLVILTCQSQQYYSLVTDGAKWNQEKYIMINTPYAMIDEYLGQEYSLGGDTTIDSKQYKQVLYARTYDQTFVDGAPGSVFCCPIDAVPGTIGAMREESRQVFFRSWSPVQPVFCGGYTFPMDSDMLLYDFNLQVNDVVQMGFENHLVTAIDSVQLLNGEWRKRWTVYGFNGDVYWIEGIGSAEGLFEPFALAYLCYNSVTCYHLNQEKLYGGPHYSPDYVDCGLLSVGIDDPDATGTVLFELYPNPSNDVLTLRFNSSSAGNYGVVITDVLGRTIYKDVMTSGNTKEISLKRFSEGNILFCQVWKDEKLVAARKVFVE